MCCHIHLQKNKCLDLSGHEIVGEGRHSNILYSITVYFSPMQMDVLEVTYKMRLFPLLEKSTLKEILREALVYKHPLMPLC